MIEEWKNVTVAGKTCPWYSVSNYGNIISHIKTYTAKNTLTNKLNGCVSEYIPTYNKVRNLLVKRNSDGTPKYVYVKLGFPLDFFDDTNLGEYVNHSLSISEYKQKRKTFEKELKVHKLVMETFKPVHLFPPKKLQNCWSSTPEEATQWIKEAICINHIDHNPCNNHISNLEYTNTIDNSLKAIYFYGGNFKNKRSHKIDASTPKLEDLLYG